MTPAGIKEIIKKFLCFFSVPLTEARRQRIALDDEETRRVSSRGLIPKAKVKTVKMTFVIIFGKRNCWKLYSNILCSVRPLLVTLHHL